MTREETKFTAERWWASSPEFVLFTLERHLVAAAAIWPELARCKIVIGEPDPPKPAGPTVTTSGFDPENAGSIPAQAANGQAA